MSYDIYLQINTGIDYHSVYDVGNYTSNVQSIWCFGLGRCLSELNGMKAEDCVPMLESAIAILTRPENRKHLRTIEPSNGWGDADGATLYLQKLLDGCRQHPATTVRIYR